MFKLMSELLSNFFSIHIWFILPNGLCCYSDPVLKLYLWDKAAFQFYDKFKASVGTARVILVTTLNPKRFGGL